MFTTSLTSPQYDVCYIYLMFSFAELGNKKEMEAIARKLKERKVEIKEEVS